MNVLCVVIGIGRFGTVTWTAAIKSLVVCWRAIRTRDANASSSQTPRRVRTSGVCRDDSNVIIWWIARIAGFRALLGCEITNVIRCLTPLAYGEARDEPIEVLGQELLLLNHRLGAIDYPEDVDGSSRALFQLVNLHFGLGQTDDACVVVAAVVDAERQYYRGG